jgi:hypothetical protein
MPSNEDVKGKFVRFQIFLRGELRKKMANVYISFYKKVDGVDFLIEKGNQKFQYSCLESGVSNLTTAREGFNMNGSAWYTISGLDTNAMVKFIQDFLSGQVDKSETFKGTMMGGKSSTPYSKAAMILKKGIPDGIEIPSGVVFHWDKSNFLNYILKISQTLNGELAQLP